MEMVNDDINAEYYSSISNCGDATTAANPIVDAEDEEVEDEEEDEFEEFLRSKNLLDGNEDFEEDDNVAAWDNDYVVNLMKVKVCYCRA